MVLNLAAKGAVRDDVQWLSIKGKAHGRYRNGQEERASERTLAVMKPRIPASQVERSRRLSLMFRPHAGVGLTRWARAPQSFADGHTRANPFRRFNIAQAYYPR
jgi:hypothetical protein